MERRASLLPPPRALAAAAALLAPLVVAAGLVAWLAGPAVTLAFALGVLAGVPAATAATTAATRTAVGALCVAGAVAGSLVGSSTVLCALVVAALGIAQGPLTRRASGIGMLAPVLAAVFATVDVATGSLGVGLGVAGGFAFVQVVARALHVPRTASPVPADSAWRHAVVFAVLAGAAVLVTRSLGLGHGYWLVIVLAAVLRPASRASRTAASARLAGTVTGVVLAIVAVVVLPDPATIVVAALCALLTVGYAIVQDVERQAMTATPVIILLGSSGSLSSGVGLGVERLALTAVAAVLAVGAAAFLERSEVAPPRPDDDLA